MNIAVTPSITTIRFAICASLALFLVRSRAVCTHAYCCAPQGAATIGQSRDFRLALAGERRADRQAERDLVLVADAGDGKSCDNDKADCGMRIAARTRVRFTIARGCGSAAFRPADQPRGQPRRAARR